MIKYVTGNLLEDSAEALVNTVNCEGFMGKGLAYQFKLNYPETNKDYIKACKQCKLLPGIMHSFREHNKLIINFPTKNKWRSRSKIQDIESGLDALVVLINKEHINSIAIPPLGCGNGGLDWKLIQKLIEKKLETVNDNVEIRIYSPSVNAINHNVAEPQLGIEAYILMVIKEKMDNCSMQKLYAALNIINMLSNSKYLCTKTGKVSVRSLNAECKKIEEFQCRFNCSSITEAQNILYNKIVSKTTIATLKKVEPVINNVCRLLTKFRDDNLEDLLKLCHLFMEQDIVEYDVVDESLQNISSGKEIINEMIETNIVDVTLLGYSWKRAIDS